MMSRLVSLARDSRINARLLGTTLLALLCAVTAVADVTYEYDEAGRLRKATHDNGMVTTYVLDAAGNRTSVTTNSGATAGSIEFVSATYSVGEAGTTAAITLRRVSGTSGIVGASVSTSNGSATAGSDYTAVAGQVVTWANADSANKTVNVTITQDSAVEGNETVNLALSAPTGGGTLGPQTTAVLTITDDDSAPAGSVQFSGATYSVTEAGPTVTITATRTGGTNGAVGVTYGTSNGTATAASDYTAASGTLSWTNGESASKTFTVTILEDAAVEGSETVNLTLSAPTGGATLGSQSTAVLTITDNDSAPVGSIQFSGATYSVTEAGPTVTITATRTGGTNGAVGVTYATSNGTATAASDYTAASSTLSWANGDSASKTFAVTILEDSAVEGSETVNLALSAPTGGATLGSQSAAVLTITDNDNPPAGSIQFTASATSVAENGGSITITASRIGGSFGAIGASYGTANGSATATSDYTAASGTLSWSNGDTANKTVTVTILDDSTLESAETFTATLSAPTGGASIGGTPTITVTINENDAGPAFSIANVTPAETAGSVTLTVTKTGSTTLTHNVSYTSANGSAAAGADYTAVSSSLSFAPGETSKTFTVAILDDSTYEQNETFTVSLSGATNGATISSGTATVTINDNDSSPAFSIANVIPGEAAGSVTLTVTKTGSSALTHDVSYASANGTAAAGSDYTAVSSSLSFAPGEASKTFTVAILDDSTYEQNEAFTVSLSGATNGATISAGTATVTINDNDGGPVFSIASATPAEASGGIALTITKSGSSALTHSVSYASSGGTATAGVDYTAVNSSISFSPGESSKTINVPILDDSVYEGNENFLVTLSGATDGASVSGGSGQASVTIVDNESPPVFTLGAANVTVNENGGTVTITVNKSGGTVYTHDVSYISGNGTAISGADFTGVSGTLSFAPGESSKTFSVSITNDAAPESSETFSVALFNPTVNATLGNPNVETISITDDDPSSTITISNMSLGTTGFPSASTAYYLQNTGSIGGNAPAGLFWLTPQVGMGDYEVLANGSGTVCEGMNWNTWVPLSSTRGWSTSVNDPNGGGYTEACSVSIQIRRIGTSTILGSALIELSATSQ